MSNSKKPNHELKYSFSLGDIQDKNTCDFLKSRYWHYTNISALKSILTQKKIWLSDLGKSNDLFEKDRSKNKHIYSVSFCNVNAERIPMWIIYSGLDKGGAIGFLPSSIKEILGNVSIFGIKDNRNEDAVPLRLDKDIKVSFNWVLYKSNNNKKIVYRNEGHSIKREEMKEIENLSFLKQYPWEYEHEFRIIVKVIGKTKKYKRLELDISKAKDIQLKLGPCFPKKEKDLICKEVLKNKMVGKIVSSGLGVDIDLFSKNRESFLMYLNRIKNKKEYEDFIIKIKTLVTK